MKILNQLKISTAMVAVVLSTHAAHAQAQSPPVPAPPAAGTPGQSATAPGIASDPASEASASAPQAGTVEPAPQAAGPVADTGADIVVTAQKRVENVQDVPKAVDVVSQSQLTQAGVTNLQDLGRVSPSIQGISFPGAPPAIRGISSFALSIGVQTQTGVVLDDVPQPSFSTLANELSDVERVEVLPGPQSTLSGRNAAGGLINIVTHSPTSFFTGTANIEQTSDRQTRISGFVSGPVAKSLDFSLSAFYNKWDGNIRNVGENGLLLNGFNRRGARLKLRWELADNFTVSATGFFTKGDFKSTGILGGSPYIDAAPTAGSVFAPPGTTLTSLHPGAAIGPYSNEVSYPSHGISTEKNYGGSLRLDYDTSFGTISSITSYSKTDIDRRDLVLAFPLGGNNVYAYTGIDVTYKTEEIRLASSPRQGGIQYLIGAIYSDTENVLPYRRPDLFPVNWQRAAGIKSGALYGRGTYEFIKDTSLTLGLRYQYDHQSYDFNFVDGSAPRSSNSSNYDFIAGEVSLQHKFTRDIKGYLTYANAQSGRAYDLEDNSSAATPAGLQPIPSQKVQNYEVGLKTQWFDRRLTVNISAFKARYSNYQVQSTFTSSDPNVIPVIRLFAIGKVQSQGVEIDTNLSVSKNLRIGLSATYLDGQILSYPGANCYVGQTSAQGCVGGLQNRTGMLPGTSKFRTTASANYTLPLDDLPFDGVFGAFYRYQSRTEFDLLGDPVAQQGGFGVLNLTAGIRDHSKKITAELFVNNVTNSKYYASVSRDTLSPGFALNALYARDSFRYWGGRVGVHF